MWADRVVLGVGCDDAMEAASMSKEGIRPTGCDEVLKVLIPYVHTMSGFRHVWAQQGTASPPGQAWEPFQDGAEGTTCLPHMYQTKYCECRRRSTLTPLVVNNLGWLVEDLVNLLRTQYSPPLREGPMVSVQQSHRGRSH